MRGLSRFSGLPGTTERRSGSSCPRHVGVQLANPSGGSALKRQKQKADFADMPLDAPTPTSPFLVLVWSGDEHARVQIEGTVDHTSVPLVVRAIRNAACRGERLSLILDAVDLDMQAAAEITMAIDDIEPDVSVDIVRSVARCRS